MKIDLCRRSILPRVSQQKVERERGVGKNWTRRTGIGKRLVGFPLDPSFALKSTSTSKAAWLASLTPVLSDPGVVAHTPF